MKSILKWNKYVFQLNSSEDTTVVIIAPTFVEAINAYHEVTHAEPYSVHFDGPCFLLDSE